MATIVAAAGGGNWTVGATWVGGVAPTAADDAQLTVASGAVTIDTGAVARSLDCTTYTGTLTHTAAVTLNLGDATAGAGNIALKLVAGMTYTLGSGVTSAILFKSTSATQQTIDSGGKTLANFLINGVGSSYILAAAITVGTTATFFFDAGTFNTGNLAVSMGLIQLGSATAKILTLGSSAIAITGNSQSSVNYSGSNATFTANTAVMTFTSANSAGIAGTAANWGGLSLVATSAVLVFTLGTSGTFNNVTYTGGANKTSSLLINAAALVITGTLTTTGNSTINRILLSSATVGTARTVTVTTGFALTNVDFADITAAGAAGTWTGTSMGNALGNTNITFDAPVTQTHTATAGGNWSDVTKWTSRVPLPQDNVVVDVNTTGTLTADMPRLGADITFTGFAGTFSPSVSNTSYGSMILGSGMSTSGTLTYTFAGRSAYSLTNNGRTLTFGLVFGGPGGTCTIQDAFISSRDNSTAMALNAGTLTVNNASMTFTGANSAFGSATGTTLNMGTNTWSFGTTAAITFWAPSTTTTLNASTSTIVLTAVSANARIFAGGGKTYGTLTYTVAGSTGSLTIVGANTFNTINFSDATNGRSLLFTPATTTTVTSFNVFGGPGRLVVIDSVGGVATHTLLKLP